MAKNSGVTTDMVVRLADGVYDYTVDYLSKVCKVDVLESVHFAEQVQSAVEGLLDNVR
jgi:hypothetical protein